ncbi:MAG: class I SAM-dependent methyltransferase [Steroidobacteraceae bacterium]
MRSTSTPGVSSNRVVEPEQLDSLPPHDPRARRSRRDLRRVHRAMRSLAILLDAIERLSRVEPPRRILELGAGDASLTLRLVRALQRRWRGGDVVLLDRQRAIESETLEGFAALGWNAQTLCMDALEWARSARRRNYDLCLTTLFLHHFRTPALTEVLAAVSMSAAAFIACEPRRNAVARIGSRCIVLLGGNEVTREDAVTSVAAGFAGHELTQLWPAEAPGWELDEYFAWPFTHCFVARRAVDRASASR